VPDVYTTIVQQPHAVIDQLAAAMELRAADPRQRAFVANYLAALELPTGARVVEIGCGTGAIARLIAADPAVEHVTGVDPSPGLIARARELSAGHESIEFHVADGGATPLGDGTADAVVLHTVLSHAPDPAALLGEARRLLRPEGRVVVFDGDYATLSFAAAANDPLELCAAAFRDAYINDSHVMRRAPILLQRAGFALEHMRSDGYTQIEAPDYLLSVLDRGAEALAVTSEVGSPLAEALKAEARRRIDEGRFFGFVSYLTMIGRRA
jgi:arsenite methyltransferase